MPLRHILLRAGLLAAVGGAQTPRYAGVLTFAAAGDGDPLTPATVRELDLATGRLTTRFDGLDATRARSGETAFIRRLAGGYYADHAVVVADARGVLGAPLHLCRAFNWSRNRGCGTPKLAPDGRRVAFTYAGGGGSRCTNSYGMAWADYVVVTDRRGVELGRFEGYADPEWLADGRLLMMGSACRDAGVWVADATPRRPARVDGGRVTTPATRPAASPDGGRVAFVWKGQLWALSLAGRPALERLTRLPNAVTAGAWSPDGRAVAVTMAGVSVPARAVALFRPGEPASLEIRRLAVAPYGPLSWR